MLLAPLKAEWAPERMPKGHWFSVRILVTCETCSVDSGKTMHQGAWAALAE